MMFKKLLQTALDSGAEIIMETKHGCDYHRGQVMDYDGQHFTLFHSGDNGGVLWTFRITDIAYCGLVVERPESLHQLFKTDAPTKSGH